MTSSALMAPEADRPTAEGAPLDRIEGNSDGCPRWPRVLWLRSSLGELVQGRCKGPNKCAYCAGRVAQENIELLALDGMVGMSPEWWVVLTTATTERRQAAYRSWWEVAKRDAGCSTARLLEFTTGYGPRSGGERRPHWNVLVKGSERDAVALLAGWQRASGSSQGHVGRVSNEGGLFRYLLGHLNKESQRPPEGWKGQRLTISTGYLWTTTAEARKQAQGALQRTWALARAEQRGLTGEAVVEAAESELRQRAEVSWELIRRPVFAQ